MGGWHLLAWVGGSALLLGGCIVAPESEEEDAGALRRPGASTGGEADAGRGGRPPRADAGGARPPSVADAGSGGSRPDITGCEVACSQLGACAEESRHCAADAASVLHACMFDRCTDIAEAITSAISCEEAVEIGLANLADVREVCTSSLAAIGRPCEPNDGRVGECIDTNRDACHGELLAGYCPGSNNILCCVTDPPPSRRMGCDEACEWIAWCAINGVDRAGERLCPGFSGRDEQALIDGCFAGCEMQPALAVIVNGHTECEQSIPFLRGANQEFDAMCE